MVLFEKGIIIFSNHLKGVKRGSLWITKTARFMKLCNACQQENAQCSEHCIHSDDGSTGWEEGDGRALCRDADVDTARQHAWPQETQERKSKDKVKRKSMSKLDSAAAVSGINIATAYVSGNLGGQCKGRSQNV
jgi:hypothetical protein